MPFQCHHAESTSPSKHVMQSTAKNQGHTRSEHSVLSVADGLTYGQDPHENVCPVECAEWSCKSCYNSIHPEPYLHKVCASAGADYISLPVILGELYCKRSYTTSSAMNQHPGPLCGIAALQCLHPTTLKTSLTVPIRIIFPCMAYANANCMLILLVV